MFLITLRCISLLKDSLLLTKGAEHIKTSLKEKEIDECNFAEDEGKKFL